MSEYEDENKHLRAVVVTRENEIAALRAALAAREAEIARLKQVELQWEACQRLIATLQAQLASAREALEKIVKLQDRMMHPELLFGMALEIARAATAGTGEENKETK